MTDTRDGICARMLTDETAEQAAQASHRIGSDVAAGGASHDVHESLSPLHASAEPNVVFDSMAAQCVRVLCDDCTVDLVGGTDVRRIVHPPSSSSMPAGGLARIAGQAHASGGHHVRLTFSHICPTGTVDSEPPAEVAHEPFCGVATFSWHRRVPIHADRMMAAAMVDRALQVISRQRSDEAARRAWTRAEHLHQALLTSRRIGAAIGILMSLYKITQEEAFGHLQQASQVSNRKLRDLALDVIDTGWLDLAQLPTTVDAAPPEDAEHRRRGDEHGAP